MTALGRCPCGRPGYPPDPELRVEHPELCLYEFDGTGSWLCRLCVVRLIDESAVVTTCIHGRDREDCFPCEILRAGTQP